MRHPPPEPVVSDPAAATPPAVAGDRVRVPGSVAEIDPGLVPVAIREGGRRIPRLACRNCGDRSEANFCPRCGQKKVETRVSLRRMIADFLDDQFTLGSALPRSVAALLFLPGELTRAYVRGRIARYVAPFRLYLASSVVFFLLLTLLGQGGRVEAWRAGGVFPAEVTSPAAADAIPEPQGPPPGPGEPAAAAGPESAASSAGDAAARADAAREIASLIEFVEKRDGALRPFALLALRKFEGLPLDEALGRLRGQTLQYIPKTMFVLVPLYALLLKLLYLRRRRFYVEHFVFSMHVHAFAFLMLIPFVFVKGGWLTGAILLWMPLYVFLAMKRVYGQGVIRTSLKYAIASLGYMMMVFVALFTTLVVAIYLL
jgi:hypothetical protein